MTAQTYSGTFWGQEKKKKEKKLGYYEIEHIDYSCILTLAVNPKEYFELFEDKNLNKKHKVITKGSSGLGFENQCQGLHLLVVAGEMVRTTVRKRSFSQLNDKRFYFPDGVVSLPFHHPVLAETD